MDNWLVYSVVQVSVFSHLALLPTNRLETAGWKVHTVIVNVPNKIGKPNDLNIVQSVQTKKQFYSMLFLQPRYASVILEQK
jgi:hypothetical protein